MGYKKLVSLLAVSALALGACADDAAEEPATDETEEVTEVEETEDTTAEDTADEAGTEESADGEGSSTQDLLKQAQEQSGEAFPEYGLYVAGNWTEEGTVVEHAPGEAATVPVQITTEHEEYNVYLVEDGVITEVVSNEPEVEFTVESPSADATYQVGISPDDLGQAGDEVAEEDFYRVDTVVFEEAEPAAEEE